VEDTDPLGVTGSPAKDCERFGGCDKKRQRVLGEHGFSPKPKDAVITGSKTWEKKSVGMRGCNRKILSGRNGGFRSE